MRSIRALALVTLSAALLATPRAASAQAGAPTEPAPDGSDPNEAGDDDDPDRTGDDDPDRTGDDGAPAADAGELAPTAEPGKGDAQTRAVYDRAFDALVAGQLGAAVTGFERAAVEASDPDRRAAARELARLARELDDRGVQLTRRAPAATAAAPASAGPPDDRSNAGRIEFVVSSTLASLYTGFALTGLLDVDDLEPSVLIVSGVTGAGFVASLFGSRPMEITGGMGESYTLGLGIGLANGLLLASPIGLDDSETVLSFSLGTMAVGGGAAFLLARQGRPTVGQTTFTGTVATLGIATTALGIGVVQPELEGDQFLLLLTAGLDLGAAVGIGFSKQLEWSKARSRLVSLSSFLGALAGAAAGATAVGEPEGDDEVRIISSTVLAGMWGGFGLGAYLTRDMEADARFQSRPDPPVAVAPMALEGGGGVSVSGAF